MASLIFLYQGTPVLNFSTYNLSSSISSMEHADGLNKKDEPLRPDATEACRLPSLDPFHPSVVQFMKDLGELRCEGVSYSSFENNVLRVEGEDIVSAQYRKIERTPGNDFDVVLSDPVSVQKTGHSPGAAAGKKGKPLTHHL